MTNDDPLADELAQHEVRSPAWYRCRRAQMLRLASFTGPDHWTYRQIAARYGLTENGVQTQLRQAQRERGTARPTETSNP